MRPFVPCLSLDRTPRDRDTARTNSVNGEYVEVELFWNGAKVGSALISPNLVSEGPAVVVQVPHHDPSRDDIDRSFEARTRDGRRFGLDLVKVRRDTGGTSSTISGYLLLRS